MHSLRTQLYVSCLTLRSMKPYGGYGSPMMDIKPSINPHMVVPTASPISPTGSGEAWKGRSIAGPKLRLCDFSAFLDQQRDADMVRQLLFFLRFFSIFETRGFIVFVAFPMIFAFSPSLQYCCIFIGAFAWHHHI